MRTLCEVDERANPCDYKTSPDFPSAGGGIDTEITEFSFFFFFLVHLSFEADC